MNLYESKIRGKIDAIKEIRSLGCVIEEAKSENGCVIQRIRVNVGLKEAKDLVEAIGAVYTLEQDSIKVETVASLHREVELLQVANNNLKMEADSLRESVDKWADKYYDLKAKVRDAWDFTKD